MRAIDQNQVSSRLGSATTFTLNVVHDAGVAAACFSFPILVVAFDSRPPIGSRDSWRLLNNRLQQTVRGANAKHAAEAGTLDNWLEECIRGSDEGRTEAGYLLQQRGEVSATG
jgi:hypothetical protein